MVEQLVDLPVGFLVGWTWLLKARVGGGQRVVIVVHRLGGDFVQMFERDLR